MNLTPAGPPDEPELYLTGSVTIGGLTLSISAIAVVERDGDLVAHPNYSQRLTDLYHLGRPHAGYEANGRRYVVFGLSECD